MAFFELTLPLDHQCMPDEVFPFATRFFLAPKDHPEKGIVIGSETGTCITLPAEFAEFRKSKRLDEVPVEDLFFRSTVILDIPKKNGELITVEEIRRVLSAAELSSRDALLIRTGWGDSEGHRGPGARYVLESPHFSLDAAEFLASNMERNGSNLLLTDVAVIGWPAKHLIPEWSSICPIPACHPSPEARVYIHLYPAEKLQADFAAEIALARAGIMTVKRLVGCGAIAQKRVRIIVSPLKIVRGVSSTCRVVAVQND